jgi:glutathione S-transferase
MLTLYFAPGSSSMAVHIALHEIGVAFDGRPMSFKNNDMGSPGYLALNPEGKVPSLVIDGRPLTEVAAILFYLAKRFPETELLPPLPRCIPRAGTDWIMPGRSGELPTDVWETAGRSTTIRSPTSIFSGSIGGSPIR